jgi:hypothetical protein
MIKSMAEIPIVVERELKVARVGHVAGLSIAG